MQIINKGARPLHVQIIESLEERIQSGMYRPDEQFPTEVLLSQEFGVSRGTIRKALQILEDQGVLVRVAGKGTFINSAPVMGANTIPPEPKAETAANLIGIALPYHRDRLSTHILSGVERVLRGQNYGLIYTNVENNIRVEFEQLKRLKAQRVAGVILFPLAAEGELELLQELIGATPTVLVDRELPAFCGSVVMSDHFQGAYTAVKHLLDLGHRRIACVSHIPGPSSVEERIRGYEQAMREANLLPYAPVILMDNQGHMPGILPSYSPEELKWVDHMLSINEPPSAVFCINDNVAIGVMRLALQKGLRVPDDLAIAGFDNSDFGQLMPVPLTSVEQQEEEIGVKAAELLLAEIANPEIEDQKIILPTRLIVRASTKKV